MKNPLLIVVNGLPASGKTTLAQRLGADLALPVFSRDGIYATLFDALESQESAFQCRLGSASFMLLYKMAGSVLAAGQPLLVEGFFGRPELRTAEFLDLKRVYNFEPVQILCKAAGPVLLERYLLRMRSLEKNRGLQDAAGFEQYKERLLKGELRRWRLVARSLKLIPRPPLVLIIRL